VVSSSFTIHCEGKEDVAGLARYSTISCVYVEDPPTITGPPAFIIPPLALIPLTASNVIAALLKSQMIEPSFVE